MNEESVKKAYEGDEDLKAALVGEKLTKFSQGFRTDWETVFGLLKEAKCWGHTRIGEKGNEELFLISKGSLSRADARFIFSLYDFPNGQIGPDSTQLVFPIISANSPTMAVYLPIETMGFKTVGIASFDTRYDDLVTPRIEHAGPPAPSDGVVKNDPDKGSHAPSDEAIGGGATQHKGLNPECRSTYFGPTDDPRARRAAANEVEKFRTAMGVNMEIETLGVPDLLPGEVVNLRGLGSKISGAGKKGNYGVFEITHTMNLSGMVTKFTALSNSSPLSKDRAKRNKGLAPKEDASTSEEDKQVKARTPGGVERAPRLEPVL